MYDCIPTIRSAQERLPPVSVIIASVRHVGLPGRAGRCRRSGRESRTPLTSPGWASITRGSPLKKSATSFAPLATRSASRWYRGTCSAGWPNTNDRFLSFRPSCMPFCPQSVSDRNVVLSLGTYTYSGCTITLTPLHNSLARLIMTVPGGSTENSHSTLRGSSLSVSVRPTNLMSQMFVL